MNFAVKRDIISVQTKSIPKLFAEIKQADAKIRKRKTETTLKGFPFCFWRKFPKINTHNSAPINTSVFKNVVNSLVTTEFEKKPKVPVCESKTDASAVTIPPRQSAFGVFSRRFLDNKEIKRAKQPNNANIISGKKAMITSFK